MENHEFEVSETYVKEKSPKVKKEVSKFSPAPEGMIYNIKKGKFVPKRNK